MAGLPTGTAAIRGTGLSPNTVQLGAWIVAMGGPVGWGQVWCRARLTCHLTYLRLMSRGLLRCRRAGLSRRQSNTMAWRQPWSLR